jgi:hypothetical protein
MGRKATLLWAFFNAQGMGRTYDCHAVIAKWHVSYVALKYDDFFIFAYYIDELI